MLRSWTERLRIYLHPGHIALVRETGLFGRLVTAKQAIPVEASGEHAWSGALTTLHTVLQQPEWKGARATVILSGHFAKFRIVSSDGRLNEEEKSALLQHRFEEIYGEVARTWQVVIADGGFGRPWLACAVDLRLMEAIQNACSAADVRLVSVKPYLMTAFNHWRREIPPQGAWLIFAEPTCLTVALVQHGAWRGIRSQSCAPGWEAGLELLLAREALLLGVDAASFAVYFSWPERPGFKLELPERFKVHALHLPAIPGYLPTGDKNIAMALCA